MKIIKDWLSAFANLLHTPRTAIQFGTYKGNDDFYETVKNENFDLIILVEPQEEYNPLIEDCYKDLPTAVIENIAIDPDPSKEVLKLWICHCLTSSDKHHILSHHPSQRVEFKDEHRPVPCFSPTQLFEKYNLSTIDFLSIDCEGMDEEIIYSLDFDKFTIKKIDYEKIHINSAQVENFLQTQGYKVYPASPTSGRHANMAHWNNVAELREK